MQEKNSGNKAVLIRLIRDRCGGKISLLKKSGRISLDIFFQLTRPESQTQSTDLIESIFYFESQFFNLYLSVYLDLISFLLKPSAPVIVWTRDLFTIRCRQVNFQKVSKKSASYSVSINFGYLNIQPRYRTGRTTFSVVFLQKKKMKKTQADEVKKSSSQTPNFGKSGRKI